MDAGASVDVMDTVKLNNLERITKERLEFRFYRFGGADQRSGWAVTQDGVLLIDGAPTLHRAVNDALEAIKDGIGRQKVGPRSLAL